MPCLPVMFKIRPLLIIVAACRCSYTTFKRYKGTLKCPRNFLQGFQLTYFELSLQWFSIIKRATNSIILILSDRKNFYFVEEYKTI